MFLMNCKSLHEGCENSLGIIYTHILYIHHHICSYSLRGKSRGFLWEVNYNPIYTEKTDPAFPQL